MGNIFHDFLVGYFGAFTYKSYMHCINDNYKGKTIGNYR
jgi:hypothetical protein